MAIAPAIAAALPTLAPELVGLRPGGRVARDIPVNHAANFAPVLQPTLDTGTQALIVAALAWLAH